MPLFFTFIFPYTIHYRTWYSRFTSHNLTYILYDEACVCEWNCWYYTNHITYIDVMRLWQAGFWHGTGDLKVTVSSGMFGLFSPTGTRTCTPHIRGSSRAVSEWQPAYPRQLISQTVHILQLDSVVTDSLPRGSVVMPFQPYFPITWPGSSTVTPPYQWRWPFLKRQMIQTKVIFKHYFPVYCFRRCRILWRYSFVLQDTLQVRL